MTREFIHGNLAVADPDADIENILDEGKVVMQIIDHTGDTKVVWDPTNQDEVDNAKQTFNNLRDKGYAAFAVNKDGSKGEQIREFSAQSGRLIMTRPLVGG